MQFKIYPAEPDDAQDIVRFLNKVGGETDFLSFGGDEFLLDAEEEAEFIRDMRNDVMLLCYSGETLVAMGTCIGRDMPRNSHVAELGISVLKEYWNNGVGSMLLELMIEESRKIGLVKLELRVSAENEIAVKLYKKFGFEKEGLMKSAVKINSRFHDEIAMGLVIN